MKDNIVDSEIEPDVKRKLHCILMEYALSPHNQHVGSGLGGNIQYFAFVYGRKPIMTKDVEQVEIKEDSILWNPDFLASTSVYDIRHHLDDLIKSNIEKENYKFAISEHQENNGWQYKIDDSLIDDESKNIDPESLLKGETKLPDLNSLDLNSRICLCMRVCAKFAAFVDSDPDDKKYYKGFHDTISKFDDALALFSMRAQIGLERIVKHNLDEDEVLWPYLMRISKSF